MILGITGGTGCGKTTLLNIILDYGGTVLDCDRIYHELLINDRNMLSEIRTRFPEAFTDNVFDRKRLGSIVFSNPSALEDLNRITHKAVKHAVMQQLEGNPKLAAIDAIALFESGLSDLCDITVGITAPVEARIARLVKRDHISQEYAESRIKAQHCSQWFQERCDVMLENSGSNEEFNTKCVSFLQSLGLRKPNE